MALLFSIELVYPSARVMSVKFQKFPFVSDINLIQHPLVGPQVHLRPKKKTRSFESKFETMLHSLIHSTSRIWSENLFQSVLLAERISQPLKASFLSSLSFSAPLPCTKPCEHSSLLWHIPGGSFEYFYSSEQL